MSADTSWLRPSALPKLAICGDYRSDPKSGPAAERGTRMDAAFRGMISNGIVEDVNSEELEAVQWAADTVKALAGGAPLESRECMLKVEAMGLSGTMDLLCSAARWHADLKTGQVRDYEAQMALYAMACMEQLFLDEWTAYLLFADQRELVTLRFTLESAEKIARHAIANARDPGPRKLSEYCGWCAQRMGCTTFLESLGIVEFEDVQNLVQIPSEVLRDVILRKKREANIAEDVRSILHGRFVGGERIPGVSVSNRKGKDGGPGYSVVSVRYPKGATK